VVKRESVPLHWSQRANLPIREAGEVLGVKRTSIYRLGDMGELVITRVLGKAVVTVESIQSYMAKPKPRRRVNEVKKGQKKEGVDLKKLGLL
jgi:hypothetical protein